MSSCAPVTDSPVGLKQAMNKHWNWHPALPIPNSPLFERPLRPGEVFKWYAKSWLRLSMTLLVLGTATLTWTFLQPALERSVTFEFDWIAQIFLRNLGLMIVVAGSLHLYFHTFRKQGRRYRFMKPKTTRDHSRFTWGNQVLDNMFWTSASGVPIWSAYEILGLWGYANGYLPALTWSDNPFLLAPLFSADSSLAVIPFLLDTSPVALAAALSDGPFLASPKHRYRTLDRYIHASL